MHGTAEPVFRLLPGVTSEIDTDMDTDVVTSSVAAPAYDASERDYSFGPVSKNVFMKSTPGGPSPDARPGHILGRVKKYLVNGGFDMKFDDEVFPPGLEGKLPYREFLGLIAALNDVIATHRTKGREIVGIFALTILYIPFFVKNKKNRAKKRKAELDAIFEKFNDAHPTMCIKVARGTGDLVFQEWISE